MQAFSALCPYPDLWLNYISKGWWYMQDCPAYSHFWLYAWR